MSTASVGQVRVACGPMPAGGGFDAPAIVNVTETVIEEPVLLVTWKEAAYAPTANVEVRKFTVSRLLPPALIAPFVGDTASQAWVGPTIDQLSFPLPALVTRTV